MLRLVQLSHPAEFRRVALVEEPNLRLLTGHSGLYGLAQAAITSGQPLSAVVDKHLSPQVVGYETVYQSHSPWRLLPPFDHPDEPARCLVTGTGLTHKGSADNRQAMHVAEPGKPVVETDSMKMYRLGCEGGRPAAEKSGEAEWFYKGNGTILCAHHEPLDIPNFAGDGGDEAEIAGASSIGPDGTPYRVGLVQGNEFSDHVLEATNYAYLAPSKLRTCAWPRVGRRGGLRRRAGPYPYRAGETVLWEATLASGERAMCHSLANLEHHHFKYGQHRRPGDVHIHFFGADHFSFRDRIRTSRTAT